MFRTRSVSRSTSAVAISLVLLSAFLVATPLGQTAEARKCGPGGCHRPIYCDDAGVTITGTDVAETIFGTEGDDVILAKAGDDIIYAGAGNDVICGGDGKDVIFGGEGSDIVYPNKGTDIVDGGAGEDAIAYNDDTSDLLAATVSPFQFGVNLTDESGHIKKDGFAVVVDLEAVDVALIGVCAPSAKLPDGSSATVGGCATNDGYGGHDQILADDAGMSSIEDVTGSFFPLAAGNQPLVNGLYLRNSLKGNSADNYLAGSGGADVLRGGSGEDTVDYWLDSPGVSVNLSSPCVSTLGGCGTDGRGSKDSLFGIEDVNGTRYDDRLIGDAGVNVLDGGSTYSAAYNGNDVISGSGGDDILLGGTGTNTLDGGSGTDLADYSNEPGLGGISVDLSVIGPRSPGFSIDDISSMEGVIGTPSADTLIGNSTANVLNGGGGDDLLSGGGAPGGQDKDVLVGGPGTDTASYSTASGPVNVSLGLGTAGGTDVHETLTQIENAVGTASDDKLVGGRGVSNTLDGAAGEDVCLVRAEESDIAANCETLEPIVPEIPSNLGVDQSDGTTLLATFVSPDGGLGSVLYSLKDSLGNVVLSSAPGASVPSGQSSYLYVTDQPLTIGATYTWTAVATDGASYSEASAPQTVTIQWPSFPNPPQPSVSRYLTNATDAQVNGMGKDLADRQGAGKTASGEVFTALGFFAPIKCCAGHLFGGDRSGNPKFIHGVTGAKALGIELTLQRFANGYANESKSLNLPAGDSVRVAVMISTDQGAIGQGSPDMSRDHGKAWGDLVDRMNTWALQKCKCNDKVAFVGGLDAERNWPDGPGYDEEAILEWERGYKQTSGGRALFYLGDAAGCPSDKYPSSVCDYDQNKLIKMAYGLGGIAPFPQIYDHEDESAKPPTSVNAQSWQRLSAGAKADPDIGTPLDFRGGMSDRPAAAAHDAGFDSWDESWRDLWIEINCKIPPPTSSACATQDGLKYTTFWSFNQTPGGE